MADLFPETMEPPASRTPRRDLRTLFVTERDGLPDGWEWYAIEAIGSDYSHVQIKGGVYRHIKTKGASKGSPDYRRPEPGTERTVIYAERDYKAWLLEREARTGLCHVCDGSGQEWRGWHHETGDRHEPCRRCNATGKAPLP